MKHCLICDTTFHQSTGWQRLFFLLPQEKICSPCQEKLSFITGKICKKCGRSFSQIDEQFIDGEQCHDCVRWQEHFQVDPLKQNRSVFSYDDFLIQLISQFKFRGDIALVQAFSPWFQQYFFQYYDKNCVIVTIPLSPERLKERGFNQSEALASLLSLPINDVLIRYEHEKQSKKSRQERLESENVFTLKEAIQFKNKHIVLIDDIYTTGTTLRHAAEVLKQTNCESISAFTLVRG